MKSRYTNPNEARDVNQPCHNRVTNALTLLEVIVVIAAIAILAFFFIYSSARQRINTSVVAPRISCINILKQISLSMRQWAIDHDDRWPWHVSATNGGAMEFAALGSPAPLFRPMSNELSSPKILVCPADTRTPATNFDILTSKHVSYFLSMDAVPEIPNAIVAGDRNLQIAGKPVKPGLFELTTNVSASWTHDLHNQCGNILFADGHVEALSNNVSQFIQRQGLATNRLAVP